jgi:hypothetical protein
MRTPVKVVLAVLVAGILLRAKSSKAGTMTAAGATTVRLLGQGDPQWAKQTVGFSTQTMENVGCVLTALTIAINALTGRALTPVQVNDTAKANSAFTGAGIISGDVAKLFGCRKTTPITDSRNVPEIRALIDDTLAKGGLALVRVDYELGTPNSNHTIVCFGRSAAGYECADPAGLGKLITLDSNLFVQRTTSKKYFGVGCAPIFRA